MEDWNYLNITLQIAEILILENILFHMEMFTIELQHYMIWAFLNLKNVIVGLDLTTYSKDTNIETMF